MKKIEISFPCFNVKKLVRISSFLTNNIYACYKQI